MKLEVLPCQQLQAFVNQRLQSIFLVMQDLITKVMHTWSNFSRKSALGFLKFSDSVHQLSFFSYAVFPDVYDGYGNSILRDSN